MDGKGGDGIWCATSDARNLQAAMFSSPIPFHLLLLRVVPHLSHSDNTLTSVWLTGLGWLQLLQLPISVSIVPMAAADLKQVTFGTSDSGELRLRHGGGGPVAHGRVLRINFHRVALEETSKVHLPG